MNRNNRWKFVLVCSVIAWSLYEMYPPAGRDLAKQFQTKAVRKDAAFAAILGRQRTLQREKPDRPFANLVEAIGTNDIFRYFPASEAQNQANPTRAILNELQAEAAS